MAKSRFSKKGIVHFLSLLFLRLWRAKIIPTMSLSRHKEHKPNMNGSRSSTYIFSLANKRQTNRLKGITTNCRRGKIEEIQNGDDDFFLTGEDL